MDKATEQQNNKRIAKNTLLLYFRMLLTMCVSLYTSRVVLQALGVEDFGIYNVVGGVVSMFTILSGSLSAAISRFLTFELGKKETDKLKRIFSSAVTIQLLLAAIVIVVAEIVGLWFLNNKMVIPVERLYAANWVLQMSILTFCINLISVPYNAAIIAHERMSAFAYVSVLEAFGKLGIAWAIVYSTWDKLILYAILMSLIALIIRLVYGRYCKVHFEECSYHFVFDKTLLKQMFGFAGWNFIGASSSILRDHGGNILINLFYGPAVNAARGVAMQVNAAVQSFVSNFMTALNPQITKSYAQDNRSYMMSLIFKGARLSFYILLILDLPILLNTKFLLNLWLHNVPNYAVIFVQLILIFTILESISLPLITAMLATGNIRNYQIIVGGLQIMNFPASYIFLELGYSPICVYIIAIIISQLCLYARLILLRKMIGLPAKQFLKNVYFNVIAVSVIASIIPTFIAFKLDVSLTSFIAVSAISVLCCVCTELFVGCTKDERNFLFEKIKEKVKR
ncbi:MAG: lipopolysaccharide biosynthesis protein [Candidatus Saccharibacteria bacterium]|nr:lipopolysaccharide biosynthesis protein [Candidatus Saccharibacteria bacterium]